MTRVETIIKRRGGRATRHTIDEHAEPYWRESIASLLARLGTGAEGLSQTAAAARLQRYGPNVFAPHRQRGLVSEFLSHFRNPLVILLLVASSISALSGDVTSFSIITVIVLLSVVLDFIQEHRAGRAAERLRQSVVVQVAVCRDGTPRNLPIHDLVPGDVVRLSAGDIVPADGRLLKARDLFVNQALLTGEPYPVEKFPGECGSTDLDAGSASHVAFMGTSIVSGSGTMVVCRTGTRTMLGGIAASLSRRPPPTAFEVGTRNFGMLIIRLTLLLVLFVLLVNAFFQRPWLESFLFALALAVGLTPELLPMVVSVTLSRGAQRMAKRQVIVKRLAAIQNLGSMDVLCTDKTGTLTEARIRLERHLDTQGRDSYRVLQLAYLNSVFETGLKSPMDEAILQHEPVDISGWRKLDEVPFDFERRRVSVLVEQDGQRLLIVKGAPEDILRQSTEYEADGPETVRALDEAASTRIEAQFEALGREGFRVLGVAWRQVECDHSHAVIADETALIFAGFAAFLDPPKLSAAPAVQALTESGVTVKIVSGDNELVTAHVWAQLGLPLGMVLTGADIARMDDLALQARAERVNLFCRVTPAQKNRIILALKRSGHVVGYLGDGINDAPSLHSADVSLSVDSAVDVAKEAADLILLEQDLGVIHEAVIEGRRTFGNIMKYIMMGTSSNFGNMFSMAGAALVLSFLPMLPVQILLNNLLYDLSEIAIPLDTVDVEDLRRPRAWDMAFIRAFMLLVGPVSSVFDFLTFYLMLHLFHAHEALFRTGWFIESMATQVLVIFVIRTRKNPFQSRPSPWLMASSLVVVAVAVVLPMTPLGAYFGFVPPPLHFLFFLTGLVAVYLLAVDVVKRWFYRRFVVA